MLLDTSGLFCLFDRSELRHKDAVDVFSSAEKRVIHNYVLAEFVPLCQMRGLNRRQTLSFLEEIRSSPLVSVVWVTQEIHARVVALLLAQTDQRYSICDAVSMVIMRDLKLSEAFSTDHHFEQAGFKMLL